MDFLGPLVQNMTTKDNMWKQNAKQKSLEERKIEVEEAKVQQKHIADSKKIAIEEAKAGADIKNINTDTLGKNIQNLETKTNIVGSLLQGTAGTSPERLEAVRKKTLGIPDNTQRSYKGVKNTKEVQPETDRPVLPPAQAKAAAPPPEAQAPAPEGGVFPFSSPVDGVGPGASVPTSAMPTPPNFEKLDPNQFKQDTSKLVQRVTEFDQMLQDTLPEFARVRKRQKIINEERDSMVNTLRTKKFKLLAKYQQLSQNPPTFKQALTNVNWVQKIGAVIHAGMFGHLYESPTYLLDKYISKELNDLKSERTSTLNFLKQSDNMYNQMYEITQDDHAAEMATEAALLQGVKQQIAYQSQLVSSAETLQKAEAMNKEADFKIHNLNQGIEQRNFENGSAVYSQRVSEKIAQSNAKQAAFDKGLDRTKKMQDLELGEQKLLKGSGQGGQDFETQIKRAKHVITLEVAPGKKYEVIAAEGVKTDFIKNKEPAGKFAVQASYELADLSKKVNLKSYIGSFGALFTKKGEKAKRVFEKIKKIQTMLVGKNRIAIVGGGQFTDTERAFLESYFEFDNKTKAYVFRGGRERLALLLRKQTGNLETLVSVLKKGSFYDQYNAITSMSEGYKKLSRKEQFDGIASKLGYSADDQEMRDFKRNFILNKNLTNWLNGRMVK